MELFSLCVEANYLMPTRGGAYNGLRVDRRSSLDMSAEAVTNGASGEHRSHRRKTSEGMKQHVNPVERILRENDVL